ncbi:MAG: hypothetical protein QGI20_08660 [Verrucomicrobiota bacterium]|nr:hypothetical protein [Verrucomicrobiota bacterium]
MAPEDLSISDNARQARGKGDWSRVAKLASCLFLTNVPNKPRKEWRKSAQRTARRYEE